MAAGYLHACKEWGGRPQTFYLLTAKGECVFHVYIKTLTVLLPQQLSEESVCADESSLTPSAI